MKHCILILSSLSAALYSIYSTTFCGINDLSMKKFISFIPKCLCSFAHHVMSKCTSHEERLAHAASNVVTRKRKKKNDSRSTNNKEKDVFKWINNEAELLLKIIEAKHQSTGLAIFF